MLKTKRVHVKEQIIPAHYEENEQLFCDKCGSEIYARFENFHL